MCSAKNSWMNWVIFVKNPLSYPSNISLKKIRPRSISQFKKGISTYNMKPYNVIKSFHKGMKNVEKNCKIKLRNKSLASSKEIWC